MGFLLGRKPDMTRVGLRARTCVAEEGAEEPECGLQHVQAHVRLARAPVRARVARALVPGRRGERCRARWSPHIRTRVPPRAPISALRLIIGVTGCFLAV